MAVSNKEEHFSVKKISSKFTAQSVYFHKIFTKLFQNGQTALSIAQRLGYISVVETLKVVTEQEITTTTTTTIEEKYKVLAPESMQETFMSDSEDEGGKCFFELKLFHGLCENVQTQARKFYK